MNDLISLIQALVPEIDQHLGLRMNILRQLTPLKERVGRKQLAELVETSERTLRTSLEVMRQAELVHVNRQGIAVTDHGRQVFLDLDQQLTGQGNHRFYEMEQAICRKLGCQRCWIVPGDADKDVLVYGLMSAKVQEILLQFLPHGDNTVAVTGGSTLARIGQGFTPELSRHHNITFVPTRGGVRGELEIQSNTVVAMMAQASQSAYLPLYIPEKLEESTKEVLMGDPDVHQVVEMSQEADCLILSIGTAQVMAQRRQLTQEQLDKLEESGAVGEAFGVFFDREGKEVMESTRIGFQLDDLDNIPMLLTIVGGSHKSQAIEAFFKITPNHNWLICDEGVAQAVLNGAHPLK